MATGLLAGKTAIITGAASGLGRATALAFARQGASVVCADIYPSSSYGQATHELITQQGGRSSFIKTDVSNEKSMRALIGNTVAGFGNLDIMINNAGVASEAHSPKPIWDTTEEIFDKTYSINARGVFLGCKYSGLQMLKQAKRDTRQRSGTIINVGSVLGVLGKSGTPAYAAAKGAVVSMTRAAAMDFAPHKIYCNSILPGFTRTPMISSMTDNSKTESHLSQCHPLQRLGEPDEIANAAVFLASHLSDGITGLNMSVDGGLHAQLRL